MDKIDPVFTLAKVIITYPLCPKKKSTYMNMGHISFYVDFFFDRERTT